MKIYVAGYTREHVLCTFDNLPREYKSILTELQMEKLAEGIRDGFLWRNHTNKMYSCTMVSNLWDKKIDERRIPLIVSYVMDKEAAEFIMESPLRLLRVTEQLKRMEREDVLHFSSAEVMETWDDSLTEDLDWDVQVESSKVEGIVKSIVKMEVEKETEFASFVYEAKAEVFAALQMLPMAFRMNVSFSFPFVGCGAAVCDINITDCETMKQSREKSYSGWPMIQRVTIPEKLELSERSNRVFEEIQSLYHRYRRIPFKDRDAEVMVCRLEMLSYLNEYNTQPSKTIKKFILKNQSKKLKMNELLKYIETEKTPELMELVGKNSFKAAEKEKRKGKNKEEHVEYRTGNRKNMIILGFMMIVLSILTICSFHAEADMRMICVFISVEAESVVKYVLVFMCGLFAGLFIRQIGGSRKEEG